MTAASQNRDRRRGGFEAAAALLRTRIREAGESRGFAVSRLLTHWAEIVGPEVAEAAIPVRVSYARGGFGATLTLLTTGARAPLVQMQLPAIREKVNACYGYNAISRVQITQTAPTGFADGQVAFAPPPKASPRPVPAETAAAARALSAEVHDEGLRAALEALGANVLSRRKQRKGLPE